MDCSSLRSNQLVNILSSYMSYSLTCFCFFTVFFVVLRALLDVTSIVDYSASHAAICLNPSCTSSPAQEATNQRKLEKGRCFCP